ncbi:MAG: hypothetical protein JZU55_05850 [Afipia sp.]|nr:hypothetical protein [Afipia sp.]
MTNTFRVNGTTTWSEVASGAAYSRVGLQVAASSPVHVLIGTAAPAANAEDYIVLSHSGTREIDVSLETTDRVYARSPGGASTMLRGFREAV